MKKTINGQEREAISHEVDHVRAFANGLVALEIEWNNKDPFFDRDLENYKRLYADGAISLGVIVTRGRSLHESMRDLVRRFLDERQIQDLDGLGMGVRANITAASRHRQAGIPSQGSFDLPRRFDG